MRRRLTSLNLASRLRRWAACLAGALALLSPGNAAAQVKESISIATQYGYGFLGSPFIDLGDNLSFRNGASVAGYPAEFGLDFTTTASDGNFYFLHNQYCVGKCTVFTMTTVTITLTNLADVATAMRFDSQITPGHLARLGVNQASSASFSFGVSQATGSATTVLYSAHGTASAAGTTITTSDGVDFNGLTRSSNGDAWNVLDWSATNLNLMLDPIAAGGVSTLTYTLTSRVSTTSSSCAFLTACPGVQVAFGDPRNNGGGTTRRTALGSEIGGDFATGLAPVIGQLYDLAPVEVAVVNASAPLPPEPPVLPPVTYGAPFVSQVAVVPEPASWLTMIGGLAIVGIGARRRRYRISVA